MIHTSWSNGLSYISKNALLGVATEAPFPLFSFSWTFSSFRTGSSLPCSKLSTLSVEKGRGEVGSRKRRKGAAKRHCEKGPFRCRISGEAILIPFSFPHPLDFFSLSSWALFLDSLSCFPQNCTKCCTPSPMGLFPMSWRSWSIFTYPSCLPQNGTGNSHSVDWLAEPAAKQLFPYLLFAQLIILAEA